MNELKPPGYEELIAYQSVIRCTRACCASRTQRNSDARSVVRSGSWSSSIHQLTITDNSMQTINSTVACHVSILAFTSTHAQPTLPSCVRLACAALARGRRTRAEKSALSKETPTTILYECVSTIVPYVLTASWFSTCIVLSHGRFTYS